MEPPKYLAELGPIPRLIEDEVPPLACKVWIITIYGNGYAGTYDKTDKTQFAWCPLPKLTPQQRALLKERQNEIGRAHV